MPRRIGKKRFVFWQGPNKFPLKLLFWPIYWTVDLCRLIQAPNRQNKREEIFAVLIKSSASNTKYKTSAKSKYANTTCQRFAWSSASCKSSVSSSPPPRSWPSKMSTAATRSRTGKSAATQGIIQKWNIIQKLPWDIRDSLLEEEFRTQKISWLSQVSSGVSQRHTYTSTIPYWTWIHNNNNGSYDNNINIINDNDSNISTDNDKHDAHIVAGLLLLALPLAQTARLTTATFRLGRRALPAIETISENVIHQERTTLTIKSRTREEKNHLVLSLIPPAQVLLHSPHRLQPPHVPNLFFEFNFLERRFSAVPSSFVMEHKWKSKYI